MADNLNLSEDAQYVIDQITAAFSPPTRESVRMARAVLLEQMDDATKAYTEEAVQAGIVVGPQKMVVEYEFDKALGVWRLIDVATNEQITLPQPIRYLRGIYTVNENFDAVQ
jgi:hypothetical protein